MKILSIILLGGLLSCGRRIPSPITYPPWAQKCRVCWVDRENSIYCGEKMEETQAENLVRKLRNYIGVEFAFLHCDRSWITQ